MVYNKKELRKLAVSLSIFIRGSINKHIDVSLSIFIKSSKIRHYAVGYSGIPS